MAIKTPIRYATLILSIAAILWGISGNAWQASAESCTSSCNIGDEITALQNKHTQEVETAWANYDSAMNKANSIFENQEKTGQELAYANFNQASTNAKNALYTALGNTEMEYKNGLVKLLGAYDASA